MGYRDGSLALLITYWTRGPTVFVLTLNCNNGSCGTSLAHCGRHLGFRSCLKLYTTLWTWSLLQFRVRPSSEVNQIRFTFYNAHCRGMVGWD